MHRRAMKLLPQLLAFGIAACALTARADDDADRRDLQQQRSALDAQLASQTEVCEARFAVNACLDEVRSRHSAAISPLIAKLEALDARERIERATAQRLRVAERQREFAAEEGRRRTEGLKAPVAARAAPAADAATAAAAASPADSASSNLPRTPRAADPEARARLLRKQAAADALTAQNNRDQLAARQQQQRLREQAQQQRAEARARSGKQPGVALPLPTPAEVAAAVASAASAPRP